MKSDSAELFDMLLSAQRIRAHIDGMNEEQFVKNRIAVAATAYELQALGEASRRLTERARRRMRGIPWDDLRLVRNMVAHEHNALHPRTLWRTLVRDIPSIEAIIREALARQNALPVVQ